ncbi:MAG TPA: LLM class F420-dependent oxidoreductase [Candidatus Binataceae bacterium]|nr:LLM class F420-dependent oxidoreductase [Candidatus Binataceae bacterium]
MKISITLMGITRGDVLAEVGRHAERLGFASLWVPEHLVMPKDIKTPYPYADRSQIQVSTTSPFCYPFVTLAYLAAVTRKLRLGTAVCLVGERHPVILAKEVATLDCLSGGRVALGVGAGWLPEEFEALGIPYARRGARLAEYITVMRKLWGEDASSFAGAFISFDAIRSYPKPLSGARLPILMGGDSAPALKRAAKLADGWYGSHLTPDQVGDRRRHLLDLAESSGRDPRELEIIASPHRESATPLHLRAYQRVGTDELVLHVPRFQQPEEVAPALERLAGIWLPAAAQLE